MKNEINLTELATEIENLAHDYYEDLDPKYVVLDRHEDILKKLETEKLDSITKFLNKVMDSKNSKFKNYAEDLLSEVECLTENFNEVLEMRC